MSNLSATPRLHLLNQHPIREGKYVLYWMISARRVHTNHALDHAVGLARMLNKPLLIVEALNLDPSWASPRIIKFVREGMADNARDIGLRAGYYPYIERVPGQSRGLIAALSGDASVVVTDLYPCFFLPDLTRRMAARLSVRMEAVDSNGVLPLSAAPEAFSTAHSFRRFLQRNLRPYLEHFALPDPLGVGVGRVEVPKAVRERWPSALEEDFHVEGVLGQVSGLSLSGGSRAGRRKIDLLVDRLQSYSEDRNEPDLDAGSGLSPYLHFGHVGAQEVVRAVLARENWSMGKIRNIQDGSRAGWWGVSESAESFLDELVTWRELGFVFTYLRKDYAEYGSLPGWALKTLGDHAKDKRPVVYSLAQLEGAETGDGLWNAAQRQLVREGRIHNYLRMLWGKKILQWSSSPEEALDRLLFLNNRWALDGRDPNSYSGIFWVLGRFDRAWGPERSIFGTVRYMCSANTARKLSVKQYLQRYAA